MRAGGFAVMNVKVLIATFVAVLVLGMATTDQPADAATRRVALGASELPWNSLAAVDAFTASVDRTPALWTIWSNWGGPDGAFPARSFMRGLKRRHIVPLVFWQPVDPANINSSAYAYIRIIHGTYDGYITTWARAAKAYRGTIIVRFAPEMDGTWFPWSISRYGNSAKRFVKAWRHVWTIFRTVGATNVSMLWSPAQPCRCRPDLYPGDRFVDYVGFTAYNWANDEHPWRGMAPIVRDRMKGLAHLTNKPVIVPELGSNDVGGNKAAWIRDGYATVYRRYPQIKAIVYFNVDMRTHGQPDWRLRTPKAALRAYRKVLSQPQFHGAI